MPVLLHLTQLPCAGSGKGRCLSTIAFAIRGVVALRGRRQGAIVLLHLAQLPYAGGGKGRPAPCPPGQWACAPWNPDSMWSCGECQARMLRGDAERRLMIQALA